MNRIDQKFKDLKEKRKKAFIAFITAGDPNLKLTEKYVLSFEKSGVDIVELGVPFSDPMADGPTIQASSQRALDSGTTLPKILESVKNIRKKSDIPIALMMYYNQVFHYGEKRFVLKLKSCGVDGLIIPDLPVQEAQSLIKLCRKADISTIFFLAPTTTRKRIKPIAQASTGFIYYVSLTGVTGARTKLSTDYKSHIALAKKETTKPICIGFGISTAEQVKSAAKVSDGVIVGSAIVNKIQQSHAGKDSVAKVSRFVKTLSKAL